MKKTAEEILKAEFVDGEWEELMSYMNTDITPSIVRAMDRHADQFKPKWIAVEDRLPEREENLKYSQVPCLVNKRHKWTQGDNSGEYFSIQILVFNHEHECWDDEDGDDYNCDINDVTHWMTLPEGPERKEEKG